MIFSSFDRELSEKTLQFFTSLFKQFQSKNVLKNKTIFKQFRSSSKFKVMMKKFKLPSKKDYFGSEKATPVEMFRMLIDQINIDLGRFGVDLFTPNYNYFRSLISISFVFSAILVHIYSLFVHKHNFVKSKIQNREKFSNG